MAAKTFRRHFLVPMFRTLLKIFLVFVATVFSVLVSIAATIMDYSTHSDNVMADAAIVLGAAPWGDEPSPVFRERINHAITLYQNKFVRKIILTGGPRDAEVARDYVLKQGIPTHEVLWQNISRTTEQDLYYARELSKPEGIASFLIVSDPLHMKRAMLMAHDLDMDAQSAPTPTTRYQSWNTQGEFLLRESFLYLGYLLQRGIIRSR